MPTHVYQPIRNPPTWWDRLLVHPLETTVGVVSVFFGVLVAMSLFLDGFIPSETMAQMPELIVLLVAGLLGAGGVLALLGLNWWGDAISRGWSIERLGWLLSTGGFATYAISVSWHFAGSIFGWAVPLALGVGCFVRFWSVVMIEKSVRRTLANVEADQDE